MCSEIEKLIRSNFTVTAVPQNEEQEEDEDIALD